MDQTYCFPGLLSSLLLSNSTLTHTHLEHCVEGSAAPAPDTSKETSSAAPVPAPHPRSGCTSQSGFSQSSGPLLSLALALIGAAHSSIRGVKYVT
jgi:hypothetical protein